MRVVGGSASSAIVCKITGMEVRTRYQHARVDIAGLTREEQRRGVKPFSFHFFGEVDHDTGYANPETAQWIAIQDKEKGLAYLRHVLEMATEAVEIVQDSTRVCVKNHEKRLSSAKRNQCNACRALSLLERLEPERGTGNEIVTIDSEEAKCLARALCLLHTAWLENCR